MRATVKNLPLLYFPLKISDFGNACNVAVITGRKHKRYQCMHLSISGSSRSKVVEQFDPPTNYLVEVWENLTFSCTVQ